MFLIRVGSTDSAGVGELDILINNCSSPDPMEPNDSVAQARLIAPGTYTDLNAGQGTDLDFFRCTLEPGEAAYVQATGTSGAPIVLRRYGLSGSTNPTPPGFVLGDPYFVNTTEEAEDYVFAVVVYGSTSEVCAGYDLSLSVGPDPCGYVGVVQPPAEWLAPGLNTGVDVSFAEFKTYSFWVAANTTVQVDFVPAIQGSLLGRMWFGTGGASVPVSNSGVTWTNTSSVPMQTRMALHLNPPLGFFYFNFCETIDVQVSGGQVLGDGYCSPGVVNSTGQTGKISAQGNPAANANEFTLLGRDLPPNEFGFFLGSQTQGFVMWPGGARGPLCLGGALVRFNNQVGQTAYNGRFARTIDLTDVPEPPFFNTVVQAGQTWNFQLWHRDNLLGPASNFTEAVRVVFQ